MPQISTAKNTISPYKSLAKVRTPYTTVSAITKNSAAAMPESMA